jgi:isoquinoline 1-oxidoreductase subunit alpha
MELNVNGDLRALPSLWREESLLSVLRERFGLVGTRFGCGVGVCGACTVLVDGEAARSCMLKPVDVVGRSIVTIEGLATAEGRLHPVQQAWIDENVSQCGYCQAGQIMNAVSLLRKNARPTDEQIDAAFANNLCRCGTQQRIRLAVRRASGTTP